MDKGERVSAEEDRASGPPLGRAPVDEATSNAPDVDQLVSEDDIDDAGQDETPSSGHVREQPRALVDLAAELREYAPEVRPAKFMNGGFELALALPAGRSTREVILSEVDASLVSAAEISRWRSLQNYDGIWSNAEGAIEFILKGERFGRSLVHYFLMRPSGASDEGSRSAEEGEGLNVADDNTGIRIQIGRPSNVAAALLGGRRGKGAVGDLRGRLITAQVRGIDVRTSDEANDIAERIGDALSIEIRMAFGFSVSPQRLETKGELRLRHSIPRSKEFSFPRNSYPHPPVLLYQAGRDRNTTPLVQYWSLYQVLEFFFPRYSQEESLRQLSRFLRSPQFNAHRTDDVLHAAQLASSSPRGLVAEEDQLTTTLGAITTSWEIVDFARRLGLEERLRDNRSELTAKVVNLNRPEEVIKQLGQRIYDIRCKIAHSKNGSSRDAGPGLLPGTHHDDLIRDELPLMEFLAEQALSAAAEPLHLLPQGRQ